jgi:hypothetical protein
MTERAKLVSTTKRGGSPPNDLPYLAENRTRIETACVRQETIFARRLPGGDALADASVAKLANPWWSDQDLVESQLRTLKAEEVPPWLARFVERMLKRRVARAARGATPGPV